MPCVPRTLDAKPSTPVPRWLRANPPPLVVGLPREAAPPEVSAPRVLDPVLFGSWS